MAELVEAAKLFRQHKLLLSKSYQKLHRYIVEQCIESLKGHRTHMIGLFRDIVIDCHRDELMTPLMNYFKNEEAEYMHYLQVLDSAVVNLGRSIPPVWEPFQGSSITPNLISSLPEPIPMFEPEVTNVPQKEQSNCMDDDHISSLEVIPVSSSCPEHIPVSESDVTNLPQKEQPSCTDDNHAHIPSPEVIPDPSVSPSCPEICFDPHRYTSQNYHDQQTIHLHQCAIQLCIANLSADQMSKHVHDDEYGNHSSDYETLFKQLQPWSISVQPLNTVDIMCLSYSANNSPNIDDVNVSEMLACQNLPGG